jgi:hypothetical protein
MPTFYDCAPARLPPFFHDNALVPELGVEYYSMSMPLEIRSQYEPLLLRCKEALVAVLSVPEMYYSYHPSLVDAVQTMASDEAAPHFLGTLMMAALAGETKLFETYYEDAKADMFLKWTDMHPMSKKGFVALFCIGFGFSDIVGATREVDVQFNHDHREFNQDGRPEPLPGLLLGHTQALVRGISRATVEVVSI